ncbi:protein FAR1-RELATED SEQUENCE 9-like [Rhododendron vialii]|uniref:protein FAR1-RELATED SEQUENCE 9-like n=1 Tax=Rhododendron vialii TaxID=182163 RepID=UPI00265DED61|nr:protein FAR1-RELATED SEQUENCE 9-like [Rhododendron vialii]
MTSSQRAEITHLFFKRCVSQNNSLLDFVTRFDSFERALSRIRHNELDMDHKDVNERPHLKTMYPMESTMSELYTFEIFYIFQEELFQNAAYKATVTNEDEYHCVYTIHRVKENGSRVREVVIDKSSNHVSCSSKMFECDGIRCRHMFVYFSRMQMEDLPNEYILRRWTKSVKAM